MGNISSAKARLRQPVASPPSSRLAALLISAILSNAALADATVTATGQVRCFDGASGSEAPLTGARVELVDSDCDGSQICDDVMGTGYVAADGSFSVTGRGGDPFGGNPDVYIRVVLTDDAGVRLTDEVGLIRSFSTPEHDHNNTPDGAVVDFRIIVSGLNTGPGESPRCAVWKAAHDAYQSYVAEVGGAPPAGHFDVQSWSAIWAGTPWTNTDTAHWPIHYPASAAPHEFGHSIRHAADGNGAHFTNDVVRFRYARNHPDGCAADENEQPGELLASVRSYNFNEGWADYWEGDVSGCPGGLMTEYVELQVARQLHVWQTGFHLSRGQMVQILRDNPGAIHDTADFAAKMRSGLGVQAFALTPEQLTELSTGVVASSIAKRVQYNPERIATLLRKQIADIDDSISRLPRALVAPPQQRGSKVRCREADCEALFNSIVGPTFAAAERQVLEEQRRALMEAASPSWRQRIQRQLATGGFEEWLQSYRAKRQQTLQAIMVRSVQTAGELLTRSRAAFPDEAYEAFSSELAKARKRLEGAVVSDGVGGARRRTTGWLPQGALGTDRPR